MLVHHHGEHDTVNFYLEKMVEKLFPIKRIIDVLHNNSGSAAEIMGSKRDRHQMKVTKITRVCDDVLYNLVLQSWRVPPTVSILYTFPQNLARLINYQHIQ